MRDHRPSCVQHRLIQLMQLGLKVHLSPKDPDPHPDFRIATIEDAYVKFQKLSSDQNLEVEFGKIAEIIVDRSAQIIRIRLLGRVTWNDEPGHLEWRFRASRVGRPRDGRTSESRAAV